MKEINYFAKQTEGVDEVYWTVQDFKDFRAAFIEDCDDPKDAQEKLKIFIDYGHDNEDDNIRQALKEGRLQYKMTDIKLKQ